MLFIIITIIMITCFILSHFCIKKRWTNDFFDLLGFTLGFILGIIGVFILLAHMIFGFLNLYNCTSIVKDNLQIRYENLKENKNNDYIRPDIIEWNQDVDFGKKYCHNFWIGPYISNVYDNLERIEIE